MSGSDVLGPTPRSRLKRLPERGTYDRARIYGVLDSGKVCHVAWVADDGRPFCLPTAYARLEDDLLLHGAAKGRFLGSVGDGRPVCVTVTHVDGLVLAKSTFHSSMNYRSVVVFGNGETIVDDARKRAALDALVEHLAPGRSAEVRPMTVQEVAATTVVRVPLDEASAKIRTGAPNDAEADLELPIWAGVVPLETRPLAPEPADGSEALEVPASVRRLGVGTGLFRA